MFNQYFNFKFFISLIRHQRVESHYGSLRSLIHFLKPAANLALPPN